VTLENLETGAVGNGGDDRPHDGTPRSAAAGGILRLPGRLRDLAILLLAALACYLHITEFGKFVFEDAYITYRYAENIALGQGFVFNVGERVLGTSTPLLTLLLAGLRLIGLDVEIAGAVLYAVSLSLIALAGVWILRRFDHPNLAALYAVLVLWGAGMTLRYFGMETTLYTALMLTALIAALTERPVLTGALTGLVCLTRYDGAVFAAVLMTLMWVRRRRFPWATVAAAAAVSAPWFVFSWLYFGSILPNTLGAKSSAGPMADYMYDSLALLFEAFYSPVQRFMKAWQFPMIMKSAIVLAIVAPLFSQSVRLLVRDRLLGTLLITPILVWFGYSIITPPVEHRWYLLPGMLLLLVFCLLAWGEVLTGVGPPTRAAFAAVSGILVAAGLVLLPSGVTAERDLLTNNQHYRGRVTAYETLGNWILDHQLDDVLLLTREPGYLAFRTGNPVVDGAGLVTKDVYFHKVREDQTPMKAIIDRHRPGLILVPDVSWRGLRISDFLPIYKTMPIRTLYIRREVLQERLSALAEPWLHATGYYPVDIEVSQHPLVFDFEDHKSERWWSTWELRGFLGVRLEVTLDGKPHTGRLIHSRRRNTVGSLVSPPFLIDFDELHFLFASNHPAARAELVVNGLPVLSLGGTPGKGTALGRVTWPVSSWRGQVGILQFSDQSWRDGYLVADEITSHRADQPILFDDFETGEYDDRWTRRFGEKPTPYKSMARRFGPQLIQGEYSAVSMYRHGVQELVSRPFTIERDRIAFVVFDFGGSNTSVELTIDGEPVRRFQGGNTQRLRSVIWDISDFRGRSAVLRATDDIEGGAKGIGIDSIWMYNLTQ